MANNNYYSTNPDENWISGSLTTDYEQMLRKQQELDYYYRRHHDLISKYGPRYYGYYDKKYCRLCGKEVNPMIREGHQIELGNIIDACYNCTEVILNKIFKDLIGDKKEYCMKCYSHIKACQCEEKKKLDNLKQ